MINACPSCSSTFAGGETFCPIDGTPLKSCSVQPDNARDTADPFIGTTFGGRYRIMRRIGEGGMGVVYEAEHLMIENRVAIKVLKFELRLRGNVVERFRQEAKSASHIGHPNIVAVTDFGETPNGCYYYVMEKLEGVDLADILFRERALSPARAVRLVLQCCRALGAAHAKGIVHRDVKPENIFVMQADGMDFVKIVDFGVAKMNDVEMPGRSGRKLTKTGMIFGTPEYMAPEHAVGKNLDHRVDIYALGVILYETLTGWLPFEGDNFMEVLHKHANDPVRPLQKMNPFTRVSPELEATIFRALQKDPDERFQTMEEMAKALLAVPEMAKEPGLAAAEPKAFEPAPLPLAIAADAAREDRRSTFVTTVHRSTPAGRGAAGNGIVARAFGARARAFIRERMGGARSLAYPESLRNAYAQMGGAMVARLAHSGGSTSVAGIAFAVAACAVFAFVGGRLLARNVPPSINGAVTAHALTHSPAISDANPTASKMLATTSRGRGDKDPGQPGNLITAPPPEKAPVTENIQDKSSANASNAQSGVDFRTLIAVRVSTFPKGARLSVAGRGKVCNSTPCQFDAWSNDKITLSAELKGTKAVKTIRPSGPTEVVLTLKPVAYLADKELARAADKSQPVNDLKIPELFR